MDLWRGKKTDSQILIDAVVENRPTTEIPQAETEENPRVLG